MSVKSIPGTYPPPQLSISTNTQITDVTESNLKKYQTIEKNN